MGKFAKIIRCITLAPVMAAAMLTTLFGLKPEIFGGTAYFVVALAFLTVLPILAYPLQPLIPGFKDKGREGQRNLAMLFAVAGYVLGCIVNLCVQSPSSMWVIYLEYLVSGGCILLFNKLFGLKASGHACGVAGPAALVVFFGYWQAAFAGLAVLAVTWWASLYMKRHTALQLVGGTVIPIAVISLLYLFFVVI